MNNLNFLQLENGLRHAQQACVGDSEERRHCVRRLDEASAVLTEASKRADSAYGSWREAMRLRLLCAKHLWQRFESVRSALAELEIEARPRGPMDYWQPEQLRSAVLELAEQVEALIGDEEAAVLEAAEWSQQLRAGADELTAALRSEHSAVEDYRRVAPLRRVAMLRAKDAVDDFDAMMQDEAD